MQPAPDEWICVRDYREFFALLNLLSRGLEEVAGLVRGGSPEEAFASYRRALFDRLERLDVAPLDARAADPVAAADALLENKVSLLGTELVDIGSPIDWFATPGEDKQWQSHLGYLYFPNCLVSAYRSTGRREYLLKWMAVLDDFWKNHPIGVEGLVWSRAEPMYRNELAYGCGGEGRYPDYPGGSWLGLSCGRVLLWLSSLRDLGNDPILTDAFLANMLASIMRDHATTMFNNPRRYTPNQFFHVALALTCIGIILPEYHVSPACYLVGIERLETSMTTTVLRDGSDMEQSFNYNSGLPGRFYELFRLFGGEPTSRIEKLRDIVHRRCRFLAGLTTPLGTWPAVAKTGRADVRGTLREWGGIYRLDDLLRVASGSDPRGREEGELPEAISSDARSNAPFTETPALSAAFPFGGYYVMRSGYGRNDRYLLFKASRPAIGHMHEDCNSFVLVAHGRTLLIDSGNFNYADDEQSQRFNTYFFSSTAHNTVTIDGLSQGRLALQSKADLGSLDAPIGRRWYTSPTIDFVEGVYAEGYTEPTSHPPKDRDVRLPAVHVRQIAWIKPDLYVVVDRLAVDEEGHEYTAHWQLSPDFTPETIDLDGEAPIVRTVDREGPNVTICSAVPGRYAAGIVYGSNEPVAGWAAVGYNEKIPSPDVSVSWSARGATLAVHLVVPRAGVERMVETFLPVRDRPHEGGFDVRLVDGRRLRCRATVESDNGAPAGSLDLHIDDAVGSNERLVVDGTEDRHVAGDRVTRIGATGGREESA